MFLKSVNVIRVSCYLFTIKSECYHLLTAFQNLASIILIFTNVILNIQLLCSFHHSVALYLSEVKPDSWQICSRYHRVRLYSCYKLLIKDSE